MGVADRGARASRDVGGTVLELVSYGVERGLVEEDDRTLVANQLLDALEAKPSATFDPTVRVMSRPLEDMLADLLDDAVAHGVIEGGIASRDLFDTRLMGCLTPRPSEVIRTFWQRYERSPEAATDYLYRLAQDSDYIRTYRVARDLTWVAKTAYGNLDITINLSKPEKDPRAIAAALKAGADGERYPRCLLCPENVGYAGALDRPARQTIRLIPLTLGGSQWFLQYSPYVYYNEHCIVLSREHTPMLVDRQAFVRLLDFVRMFPHYTVGSNADLPIVGGSILTHEHFQGGRYEFAMARAAARERLSFVGFDDVHACVVDWPLSVIRLDGANPARLVELADRVLTTWRAYSDESAGILAETNGRPHNTITPIARRRGDDYELDLVLRNNRTSEEHPLGIFHPHAKYHHIKRENIGLIEVMGLAVLPARLKGEMARVREAICAGEDVSSIPGVSDHAPWVGEVLTRHPEIGKGADPAVVGAVLKEEIGLVFALVLENCGVFKADEAGRTAFHAFVDTVNRWHGEGQR